MGNNVKVTVTDEVFEGVKTAAEAQSLQDFLTEMKGVAEAVGETNSIEDFMNLLGDVGIVEIVEVESETGSAVVVKKVLN